MRQRLYNNLTFNLLPGISLSHDKDVV